MKRVLNSFIFNFLFFLNFLLKHIYSDLSPQTGLEKTNVFACLITPVSTNNLMDR